MAFRWHPNQDPPTIEEHSRAKLTVLRRYLRAYFDTLNVNPGRERFRLDLVDGFAGGGTFLDRGKILSGTPLVMLEEASAANDRLNQNRNKAMHFDCKCYFVDRNKAHTDHLRQALDERGYDTGGDQIVIRNGRFEDELEAILKEIRRRQPRAGRAIFLLDQTGFSQVALRLVSRIFAELAQVEVILTFAADALINHLADVPQFTKAVAPLEITESQVKELMQQRSGNGGRALVQRTLRDQIRNGAGATYDTPFFIRPQKSRRALWFLHLSRHPKARDVMVQRHWEVLNIFEHYGPGDFEILGWDALKNPKQLPLFKFGSL